MKKQILALLVVMVCFPAFWGCRSLLRYQNVSVGDILDNPREYDGQLVRVTGTVRAPFSLILIRYFELTDGTGSIPVVTKRPLPREGKQATVTGRVNAAFGLGAINVVVIEEVD